MLNFRHNLYSRENQHNQVGNENPNHVPALVRVECEPRSTELEGEESTTLPSRVCESKQFQ